MVGRRQDSLQEALEDKADEAVAGSAMIGERDHWHGESFSMFNTEALDYDHRGSSHRSLFCTSQFAPARVEGWAMGPSDGHGFKIRARGGVWRP